MSTRPQRLVVLGFDGLDPRVCQRLMGEKRLPNLKRLAQAGSFSALSTSIPCQSPVAWRTFATGVNPGGHGVFDFLRKQPGSYLPMPATVSKGVMPVAPGRAGRIGIGAGAGGLSGLVAWAAAARVPFSRRAFLAGLLGCAGALATGGALLNWVPHTVPLPVNETAGIPFWAHLGKAGLRTKVLRMPVEFPPRSYPNCKVLSGLGVPDAQGTNGSYAIFTTDSTQLTTATEMGGSIQAIRFSGNQAQLLAPGPPDPLDSGKRLQSGFMITRSRGNLQIQAGSACQTLQPGEWSDWMSLSFSISPLAGLRAVGRFHLVSLEPHVVLYLSPLNLDAGALPPNIAITSPAQWAEDLREKHSFFKTLGWPTDTWAYNEEHLSHEAYLADYGATISKEMEMTRSELAASDWDCLVAIFTPTDQIQHVLRNRTGPSPAIDQAYLGVDAFVGEVMDRCGSPDKVRLCVLSDHGFHPFDRAVNLNTWLWRNGYLKLKGEAPLDPTRNLEELYTGSDIFWSDVDWSNTYAYSMGLGNVYLNLEGREPDGIVRRGDMARLVLAKLQEGLGRLRDEGRAVIRSLYLGQDIYSGSHLPHAADVVVGFHPGYRVSWQTALGGIPQEIVEPNPKRWCADHCSIDPAVTSGVLYTNCPLGRKKPSLLDAAPSFLEALGIPVPDSLEGKSWWT